jgi:endonuclease III
MSVPFFLERFSMHVRVKCVVRKRAWEIRVKQSIQRVRNPADYGYPSTDIAALSAKALEVTRRLTEAYGESRFSNKDPMSMLVDIILSHRTRDEQTAAAYANLLKRFGSWEAVRDAPTQEVQGTIANVNWPEIKAPRLQAIMRQITEERGNLDLGFLCTLPVEESAAWLNRFEGVGPKTTACVLLFSCQQPLLPVDTKAPTVCFWQRRLCHAPA